MAEVEAPPGVPRMINIETAKAQMEAVGLTAPVDLTFMNWIERYGFGHKVGGKWVIDERMFHKFLRGELPVAKPEVPE